MQCSTPPPEPDPQFWQQPAFWMWVIVLVSVLVFDLIQLHRHRKDMSQFVQGLGKAHHWLRWLFLGITLLAGIHFGWGF